jgi:hypothetical protein
MFSGKHLFILDAKENWSFGLTGKVQLNDNDELLKVNNGWLYGDDNIYEKLEDEWISN